MDNFAFFLNDIESPAESPVRKLLTLTLESLAFKILLYTNARSSPPV